MPKIWSILFPYFWTKDNRKAKKPGYSFRDTEQRLPE